MFLMENNFPSDSFHASIVKHKSVTHLLNLFLAKIAKLVLKKCTHLFSFSGEKGILTEEPVYFIAL